MTATFRTAVIHVTCRTDRDGNLWTLTANPKPWRGLGGIDLSETELAERGPLVDSSYDIPPSVRCADCRHGISQHLHGGCYGHPNTANGCPCTAIEFTIPDAKEA
jgi:hypothetical protein